MTIADLIRELQEFYFDPDTPVRFFVNGYDCDEDETTLETRSNPKTNRSELCIELYSPDIAELSHHGE